MADDFQTTRWSVVLAAHADPQRARAALEWLCDTYWRPLYAFARRRGYGSEDAADLIQAYFVELLDRPFLDRLDPGEGKFRAYLLASLKHFMSKERERRRAHKRRADDPAFRVATDDAERWYAELPDEGLDPARLYERRWALTLFGRAMDQLAAEYGASGKGELFERARSYLTDPDGAPYREAAADLSMSEGAFKVAVHRMRRRMGEQLRREVAQTLSDEESVEEELRYLLEVLA